MRARTWVSSQVGPRDQFEVPKALAEDGVLASMVSTVPARRLQQYSPELVSLSARPARTLIVDSLRRTLYARHSTPIALDRWIERQVGLTAQNLAREGGHGVVAYSGGTALHSFSPDNANVLFGFHPPPPKVHVELMKDKMRFPEYQHLFPKDVDLVDFDRGNDEQRSEYAMASAFLSASSFTAHSFTGSYGSTEIPSLVVPYGCPVPSPQRSATPRAPSSFLFVGQFLQRKGLHHLRAAWQRLPPTSKASLTVVTDKPHLAGSLFSNVDNVRILGRVKSSRLQALMQTHNTLVMPSLLEGFGLVLGEALANGMHIIASRSTGLVDYKCPPESASLFTAGSVDELQDLIEHGISIRETDNTLSKEIANHWTWQRFRTSVSQYLREVKING